MEYNTPNRAYLQWVGHECGVSHHIIAWGMPCRALDWALVSEPGKIEFFTKTDFFIIQVEMGEV